jgi:hypothetical protein
MVSANVKFSNAVVYSVVKFDVKLDEEFGVELQDAPPGPIEWYAKADAVLDITQSEDGTSAKIKATGVGETKIKIFETTSPIELKILELYINVVEEIPESAVDLGLEVGQPEPKGSSKKDKDKNK